MEKSSLEVNNNRKILVIDDRDVCDVLLKNLGSFGYDTECAFSGKEGIEKTKKANMT